jgi:2-polyprenyl-3-methyl-5-hydroxy-6-metoxy-1,4-benzoquinol methylase
VNGEAKIIRACIICGSDANEPVFDYAFDFLINVRGHDEADMRQLGWDEQATSTIVKCRDCGCNFVRDILQRPRQYDDRKTKNARSQEAIEQRIATVRSRDVYKRYEAMDNKNAIVRNLVQIAAARQQRDIRFLDFGAGGGEQSNMARICGVRDVIAYDPNYVANIQEHYAATNFPGITCVRNREDLSDLGPFDAAVFQSAIEHVIDPRSELRAIYDLLCPGGILYVNNPVMNLDREVGALKSAAKIEKRNKLSYYHPGHYNYMMPRHFERLLTEVGFRTLPMVHYPAVPLGPGMFRKSLTRNLKAGTRWLQNALGLPYERYVYFVEKP